LDHAIENLREFGSLPYPMETGRSLTAPPPGSGGSRAPPVLRETWACRFPALRSSEEDSKPRQPLAATL